MDVITVVESSNSENEVFYGDDMGISPSVTYIPEVSTQGK